MAYTTANVVQQYLGGPNGRSIYFYTTTDAHTTADDASYFSDGVSRHLMKIGDLVFVVVVDSVSAPTSISSCSQHYVTSVSGNAATLSAAASGSTVTAVNNTATAAPVTTDDTTPGGYTEGSIWVDVTNDEAYINVDKTNSAAQWMNICNDVILQYLPYTIVTAGAVLRFVAPFTGRISAVRAITNGVLTGTDKLVRLVISGVTCTSGTLTLTNGSAAATKFSASPTTGNKIVAGYTIALQTGAQVCSQATVNFFLVCRRRNIA